MEAAHKQRDGWSDGEIKSSDMHKVLQMDGGGGKGRERNEEGEKLKEGEKKSGKTARQNFSAWGDGMSEHQREREREMRCSEEGESDQMSVTVWSRCIKHADAFKTDNRL